MRTGLECLAASPEVARTWGRCGLLANQASVDSQLNQSWKICHQALNGHLVALFGPQHGFISTVQDNMIETDHAVHRESGLPIYSLYGETRRPTEEMFTQLDTLIVDLQITGCRIYTWKGTLFECLQAAKEYGKKIVVLDRPNPLGGVVVEGRVLDNEFRSFVGPFAMPMRHGLTLGEVGHLFNSEIGADYEVIAMQEWDPGAYWRDLNRIWVHTSPNLPTIDPVYLFPGMVLFEGTMISEGRGTALPFQFIGRPDLGDPREIIDSCHRLLGTSDPARLGFLMTEAHFRPMYQKWADQDCQGARLYVLDPSLIRSFSLALAMMHAFDKVSENGIQWQDAAYEYEFNRLAIHVIFGHHGITDKIKDPNFSLEDPYWHAGVDQYIERASSRLLYPRELKAL